MKATGIVRRIDDLGRIVIPKEIRRTQRIHEGDPIEIYTNREGEIMLKKYSPLAELGEFAKDYADSLFSVTGGLVCITDRELVVAAAGPKKKEYEGKELTADIEKIIESRVLIKQIDNKDDMIKIYSGEISDYNNEIISVIICNGDCMGAIILCGYEKEKIEEKAAAKVIQTASIFLGKQLG